MNVYEVKVLLDSPDRTKLFGYREKFLIILSETLCVAEAKASVHRVELSDKETISVKEIISINLIKKVDII